MQAFNDRPVGMAISRRSLPKGDSFAVPLTLTGIGVISVFTATVASIFFENDRQDSAPDVHARLDHLEREARRDP